MRLPPVLSPSPSLSGLVVVPRPSRALWGPPWRWSLPPGPKTPQPVAPAGLLSRLTGLVATGLTGVGAVEGDALAGANVRVMTVMIYAKSACPVTHWCGDRARR